MNSGQTSSSFWPNGLVLWTGLLPALLPNKKMPNPELVDRFTGLIFQVQSPVYSAQVGFKTILINNLFWFLFSKTFFFVLENMEHTKNLFGFFIFSYFERH